MEIIARQRNPYFIEGPAEIGCSGGRTSGFMLKKIIEAHDGKLPPDVHVLFENTGKEREETLVFVNEFTRRWEVKIHWIEYCRIFGRDDLPPYRIVDFESASRKGEPFEAMLTYYETKRKLEGKPVYLPNHSNKMCSAYLKTKAAAWFMRNQGYEHWDKVLGIRYDEPRRYHKRMEANEKRKERWENHMPLYGERITKEKINIHWNAQPFDLGFDSDLGNCDLCWKKHPTKIMRSISLNPPIADWWIDKEDRFGEIFRSDGRSFRHLKYCALETGKQIEIFSPESDESVDCACTD